jgi:hypothetical protein
MGNAKNAAIIIQLKSVLLLTLEAEDDRQHGLMLESLKMQL